MRILYIDIDTLRPDHLGCYGYHRNTSPNIDRIAAEGVRFDNCHASDVPCLPSRSALCTGRFGIHNGAINHGGAAADLFPEGPTRSFRTVVGRDGWINCLRKAGLKTVTVSSFAERHSAWQWYAGFSEAYNCGGGGMEIADEVTPMTLDWIKRNGKSDDWFLHVHYWDPHCPYRAPESFGNPFENDPGPDWITEEVRQRHWQGCGPHSAREVSGFFPCERTPRQPDVIASLDDVKMMFDGYDTGVRYADEHVGRVLNALADQGILNDTVVIISSDHGEDIGELNIYGDHQAADQITTRIPLIARWPGISRERVDKALHYQIDWAATMVELLGRDVPEMWDGKSFAPAFRENGDTGRDYLVVSQGAWSCQRAVRFDDYICIRTYHDGYHGFPDVMLFDTKKDPHEQNDLARERPDAVGRAMTMLEEWRGEMMRTATNNVDPMQTVLNEGGPYRTLGQLPEYLQRLRDTGRGNCADLLATKHPGEAQ